MIETFAQEVSKSLTDKYGVTIPWEMIIEMILSLLQNSPQPTPTRFVESVRNPTIIQRVVMNLRIREITGIKGFNKVVAIRDCVLAEAAAKTDEQLLASFYQAQGLFGAESVVVEGE
jgi:hypothetical protein